MPFDSAQGDWRWGLLLGRNPAGSRFPTRTPKDNFTVYFALKNREKCSTRIAYSGPAAKGMLPK